jgi:hypothetical protein
MKPEACVLLCAFPLLGMGCVLKVDRAKVNSRDRKRFPPAWDAANTLAVASCQRRMASAGCTRRIRAAADTNTVAGYNTLATAAVAGAPACRQPQCAISLPSGHCA